ncbi:sialomucin core protein 24-like [Osmia bicornis bicornis]|uniref:sialomucin core protein 24-like n=1 Tax=Osmia bicornis bicornis TaxID=1437191 RepID=UPI0010F691AB|nr:sialomucin core protein 24-like [Osmia bicornis bicornis]
MRLIHITIFLATTICCIAGKEAVAAPQDKEIKGQQTTDTTNTVPKIYPNTEASNITANINKTNSNITAPAAKNITEDPAPAIIETTPNTAIPNNITTDSAPSVSSLPPTKIVPTITTTNTTKIIPPVTTNMPVPTVTDSPSTVPPPPATTAVPASTKQAPPSPSKERHFDGLSFLGGIILATSLMAIGALSWKFYRTFNERNYRTL